MKTGAFTWANETGDVNFVVSGPTFCEGAKALSAVVRGVLIREGLADVSEIENNQSKFDAEPEIETNGGQYGEWKAWVKGELDCDWDGERYVAACPMGHGSTEAEAIADLKEKLAPRKFEDHMEARAMHTDSEE